MNKFFPFLSKRRTEGRTASTRRAQFGFCCLLTPQLNFDQVLNAFMIFMVKFIYSEKATKFCEISTLHLTVCIAVKSKVEILQNSQLSYQMVIMFRIAI